jgi:hypothetical protein
MVTGEYAVSGHDVDSLVGAKGSGRDIEIGQTDEAAVHRKLGTPLVQYENGATEIFDASPRYTWVPNWTVAKPNQSSPNDAHVLLRLDYDQAGHVKDESTTLIDGPVSQAAVPTQLAHAWPDLTHEKLTAMASAGR